MNSALYEVVTKDVSASGALIVGPQLLRVGQSALFRIGANSGLSISTQGRIVRKGKVGGTKKSEWGVAFDEGSIAMLKQYSVFESQLTTKAGASQTTAVIISEHPLELFWWLSQLSAEVRTVFVGTNSTGVLEQMRKASPTRDIHPVS